MNEYGKEYTVTEAAKLKGVTRAAIHNAIKEGRIEARRVGSIVVIAEADLNKYTPQPRKPRVKKARIQYFKRN